MEIGPCEPTKHFIYLTMCALSWIPHILHNYFQIVFYLLNLSFNIIVKKQAQLY